ncbi:hypothetical protein NDU88_004564 [Pleurodeles waltl]|uniref:Ubiquitin-like protein 5 n=1 Tax=Pleurodeles waltl TaxID=8319 RepID=A0AAV7T7S5_PLEWA|nr:hypothetical protein NDU88_004564 [Pleurodeles waltl]
MLVLSWICLPVQVKIRGCRNDREAYIYRLLNSELLSSEDTIGDLKKLIAAQTGTRWDKIVLKKWYTIFKDHVTLGDYEIHDGMNLELYYQ